MIIKLGDKSPFVGALQTFLLSKGYDIGNVDNSFGQRTLAGLKAYQLQNLLTGDGIAGEKTLGLMKLQGLVLPEVKEPEGTLITFEQLKSIMVGATNSVIDKYLNAVNKTMLKYQINTPLRICHFLAQVGHESGSFRYSHEIASGSAYEGRADLGNTHSGDGTRYRGQGLIQLTGHNNIVTFGKYIGINFDRDGENPSRIGSEPDLSAEAAGWFWKTRNLNKWADADDIKNVTLRVNGGYNGLTDRKGYLKRAKSAFGI